MPLLSLLLSCAAIHPISGEDVCNEVGFTLAKRTLDCTGDADRANEAYERFTREMTCDVGDPYRAPMDRYLQCPALVGELACADIEAHGDDLVALLSLASPQCSRLFVELESAPKPEGWKPPNEGVGVNPFYRAGVPSQDRCPTLIPGDQDVSVTVNNPRDVAVVIVEVALPCRELGVTDVVPAGGSLVWTGKVDQLVRVRSDEGALLADRSAADGLVIDVPP